MVKSVVFAGTNSVRFARRLARRLKSKFSKLEVSYFPDGDMLVRLREEIKGKRAIFVQSMHPAPNKSLVQLLFAIGAARQQGAKEVVLVIPYLSFMRQDKMFHKGEAITNKIVGDLLSSADRVVTMDPHLHRIDSLDEVFSTKTTTLTADPVIAEYIRSKFKNAVVMGPDEESSQWASDVAEMAGVPSVILKKKRYTSRSVKIKVKSDIPLKGRRVVIVDDIISTGNTMIEPIKQLKRMGVRSVTCIGVHGVLAEGALERLKGLGAEVLTTNTIDAGNPAAEIDVTKVFSRAL